MGTTTYHTVISRFGMSAHQLYVHLAWTTRDRRPMIDCPTRQFLEQYFRRTAARERADVVTLAIHRTDVHMLLRTVARTDLPRLVQYFKDGNTDRHSKRNHSATSTTIFPICSPLSNRSNAARTCSRGNTRSTIGRSAPLASSRTISRYSASFPIVEPRMLQ